jgi:hypothetical protein
MRVAIALGAGCLLAILLPIDSSSANEQAEKALRSICALEMAKAANPEQLDKEIRRQCAPYVQAASAKDPSTASSSSPQPQVARPSVRRNVLVDSHAAAPADPDSQDQPTRLFVRANALDNFFYITPPGGLTGVQGASVSFTDDRTKPAQTAAVNALVSYLLVPPSDSDLDVWGENAFAVWGGANGTWNEPVKRPENTALQFGFDDQLRLRSHDPFSASPNRYWDNYFNVTPFVQTDFPLIERAGGVKASWEPVIPELLLGAGKANDYYLFYWQFRPTAEYLSVSNPGYTKLTDGSYYWLGYSARGNLQFFPLPTGNTWFDEWIVNRFALIGTIDQYWDANSSTAVWYTTAQLQYNLGTCNFSAKPDPGTYPNCKIAEGSSISFEYDHGTNKDTLVGARQYLVKLSFKN